VSDNHAGHRRSALARSDHLLHRDAAAGVLHQHSRRLGRRPRVRRCRPPRSRATQFLKGETMNTSRSNQTPGPACANPANVTATGGDEDRAARVALTWLAEPGNPTVWSLVQQHGTPGPSNS
jgi:hypothetical protein